MIARVQMFARCRDLAGTATLDVELAAEATVGDLRQGLIAACPALGALLPRCAVAVNNQWARDEQVIGDGDEVALLPPVSGG